MIYQVCYNKLGLNSYRMLEKYRNRCLLVKTVCSFFTIRKMFSSQSAQAELLFSGMNGHLSKPVNVSLLKEALASILG